MVNHGPTQALTNNTEALVNNFSESKNDKTELRHCSEPSATELADAHLSPEYHDYHIQKETQKLVC